MSTGPRTDIHRPQSDDERAAALRALLEADPPPMITKSIAAFRRDLPELLKTHRGQWVAYHGDERIGFGRSKTDLYEACFRGGLSRDDFVVAESKKAPSIPTRKSNAVGTCECGRTTDSVAKSVSQTRKAITCSGRPSLVTDAPVATNYPRLTASN
ncbi:MAG: hypothetical protein KY476_01010 [Planctomycetes bacterium]|nr:hypothetical protein [Planctomycetota bacterium]